MSILTFKLFENEPIKVEEEDEDTWQISIKGAGYVDLVQTSPKYEFAEDVTAEELAALGLDEDDMIGKLAHIEVTDDKKNMGYGGKLMAKAIAVAEEKKLMPLYLNACPIGTRGLNLKDLTDFYKEFGFTVFKSQKDRTGKVGNNLMIKFK